MRIYILYKSRARWGGQLMYDASLQIQDTPEMKTFGTLRGRHKELFGNHELIELTDEGPPAYQLLSALTVCSPVDAAVLVGSVWPTERFAREFSEPASMTVSGRFGKSLLFGGNPAIFGIRWRADETETMKKACKSAIRADEARQENNAKTILPIANFIQGYPAIDWPEHPGPRWHEVDDFTTSLYNESFARGWARAYEQRFIRQKPLHIMELEA